MRGVAVSTLALLRSAPALVRACVSAAAGPPESPCRSPRRRPSSPSGPVRSGPVRSGRRGGPRETAGTASGSARSPVAPARRRTTWPWRCAAKPSGATSPNSPPSPTTRSSPWCRSRSTRTGRTRGGRGNAWTVVLCNLATDVEDPLERLQRVHRSMRSNKQLLSGLDRTTATTLGAPTMAGAAFACFPCSLSRRAPPSTPIISNVAHPLPRRLPPHPQQPVHLDAGPAALEKETT
ncbi:WS/DGAT domain-containing protein [Pseudonocardia sp. NPDC049154]|uniref:WS/DGAT domain-containing protein n=1 Tax=Pseudonocardia sp. NPDC049154 TaxID=3155501 RepID=UPI0033E20118